MNPSSNSATLSIATTILTRAVTLDNGGRYTESLVCYQEGIQVLMEALKNLTDDEQKKSFRIRIDEYMKRAEKLKTHMETLKSSGKYREQIQIKEDSIGHSYHGVFSRFLDESVYEVFVDDPYIRSTHQCDNMLRFTELCVKLCSNLKKIHLNTTGESEQQKQRLNCIGNSLRNFKQRGIQLIINYSDSLHDREIRFDNGWIIKIGRGLDYFKPIEKYAIGWTDFDLRPCKETTIDVFHKKELVRCRN